MSEKEQGCFSLMFDAVCQILLVLVVIYWFIFCMIGHEQRLWDLETKAGLPHTDAAPWYKWWKDKQVTK